MLITSFIKEADCGSFVRERHLGKKKIGNQTDGGSNGSSAFLFTVCFFSTFSA